uniref:Uncharacterized protein n=1 Tax=Rhizophora mucronata TaxID=61149 RepID=A0A2P2QVC7_RHIMU
MIHMYGKKKKKEILTSSALAMKKINCSLNFNISLPSQGITIHFDK